MAKIWVEGRERDLSGAMEIADKRVLLWKQERDGQGEESDCEYLTV